ncbi:hypothetical protein M407DRAFT_21084 [Tulasnella calospora MUT 4182]|uniref:Uncharacterized protein n=1 Tax=Tulasnella calospora MUT 4182 TaxID=1051891 RepID=A0A0C3M853_9AGAM|nr:hypothetical protein M407DRAFT_21084 [Tulasnella calospora MUT 4182]
MNRIPPELLGAIYTILLPTPPCCLDFSTRYPTKQRIRDLNQLRLVSTRWNDVVVNTPELWNYIEISASWKDPRRMLERAGGFPLHVRIECSVLDQIDHRFQKEVEAVWATAERWRTYIVKGFALDNWFRLLPPDPLRIAEEVWLSGTDITRPLDLHAPKLTTLFEDRCRPNIEITSAPYLKSWSTFLPDTVLEWGRLMRIVQQCPQLESLKFIQTSTARKTLQQSGLTELTKILSFPSLVELTITSNIGTCSLMGYIDAPKLEVLTIQDYWSPIPFSIPHPSSCPRLNRIRFSGNRLLGAVQRFLSRISKESLDGVALEIGYYRLRDSPGLDSPGARAFEEQRKWFDSNFPVKWVLED